MYEQEVVLNHFGVKGMKWKRGGRSSISSYLKESRKSIKYNKGGLSPTYQKSWKDSFKNSNLKTKIRRVTIGSSQKEIASANRIYEGRVAAKKNFKNKIKALELSFAKQNVNIDNKEARNKYFSDLKAEKNKLKIEYGKEIADVVLKNI